MSVGQVEHSDVLLEEAQRGAQESASEAAARLAVTLAVSLSRAVLHAPTGKVFQAAAESSVLPKAVKEHAKKAASEGLDVAGMAEKMISSTTTLLDNRGYGRPEFEMTGEAFGALLRLAVQFTGPIKDLDANQVYPAMLAYMQLQKYARPEGQKRISLSELARNKLVPNRVPVKELRRYCRYTMAAYGTLAMKFLGVLPRADGKVWSNTQAIEFLTGIDTKENLVTARWRANWVGSIYKPGHYVLLDHEHKEVIVAIRGSYRFQDALTDLMCDDTPFSFHYNKEQDVKHAQEELNEVLSSVSTVLAGLKDNVDQMPVGEIETNVRDATQDIFANLQGFISRQTDLVGQEINEVFEDSSDDDEEDEQQDADDDSSGLDKQKNQGKSPREPTQYVKKEYSKAHLRVNRNVHLTTKDQVPEGHRFVQGRTHFGFLKAAQILATELEALVIQAMEQHRGYKLVLCGHSLGSAVATLITLMWSKIPQLQSVRCYGFAAPATLSLDVAQSAIASAKITSVVYHDDLVPRLSLGSVSDLRNSVQFVATQKVKGDKQQRNVARFVNDAIAAKHPPEKLASMFNPIMKQIRKSEHVHDKLFIAGSIYHIEHPNGTIELARKKKSSDISEILVSGGMFMEHVPHSYAYAICNSPPICERKPMSKIQTKQSGKKVKK